MKNIEVANNNSFGLITSDYIDNIVLAAGVAQTITVPYDATHCFFSANVDFFARWVGTPAAVPGANIIDGTGGELNPTVRTFSAVKTPATQTTFSIISANAGVVTLSYYRS